MSYWHRFCICPYYSYDEKLAVHCEAGKIKFKGDVAITDYMDKYCASYEYEKCSLAKFLEEYYRRKYEEDEETEKN